MQNYYFNIKIKPHHNLYFKNLQINDDESHTNSFSKSKKKNFKSKVESTYIFMFQI